MTLIIQKPTGAKLILRKELPADAEADAYIAAVEAADGQALEPGVKFAIKNFVLCCKQDGIWSAIKASCILAGARTLSGALVPLVGPAPTNFNFVSGNYDRKTGLVGDGSTKYLGTNRLASSDPNSNAHFSYYATSLNLGEIGVLGGGYNASLPWFKYLIQNGNTNYRFSCNTTNQTPINGVTAPPSSPAPAFLGVSSSQINSVTARINGIDYTQMLTTRSAPDISHIIFARNNNGTPDNFSSARLSFYSIGESLDLTLLDARVTDLINAFAAAIP